MNKRYKKYRFKMQQKFNKLFGNKENIEVSEVRIMKKYTTKNFFTQVMLSSVDGVNIIYFEKDNEEDREAITYEFEDNNKEAMKCINDCRTGVFRGMEIPDFNEKKQWRKKMIDEYYRRISFYRKSI